VVLSPGTTIAASDALSVVKGNTGDTINGNGVTLAGDGIGTAMTLSSSDLTLTNLTIKGFGGDLVVDPAGQSLHHLTVTKVHLDPAPNGALLVGSSKSKGRLNGLVITNSFFDGGIESTAGFISRATKGVFQTDGGEGQSDAALLTVGIGAGFANSSSPVNNASLDNVLFAHNEITNGFEGLYVFGGLAQRSEVTRSLTQNVRILDNKFPNVPDASLNAIGSEGIGSGSDNGVEHLTISGNDVTASDWGIALWGGETYADGFSQNNYVTDVGISNNKVVGAPGTSLAGTSDCIDLEGAWTTIGQGVQSGSSISDVRITDNQVSGNCSVGIKATGGVAEIPPNAATAGNSVHDVSIRGNEVRDVAIGLQFEGGYSLAPDTTLVAGNAVHTVDVSNNNFDGDGSGTGIDMIGGVAGGGSDVTSNSVAGITFEGNDVHGYSTSCTSTLNSGAADGNYNDVSCPQP
jgi:hypothetical protein